MLLFSHCRLRLSEVYDEVAGNVIGAFIRFVLVGDAYTLGHALLDFESVSFGFTDNSATTADRAWMLDRLSFTVTLVAMHLYLLE